MTAHDESSTNGHRPPRTRKVSVEKLTGMARRGAKIVMITAYDYPSADLADESGADIILVGDSLAMVVLGHASTVPITLDEMLVFMAAVSRGAQTPLLVGDLPFGSFLTPDGGLESAARVIKTGGMDAVKLEGGADVCDVVQAIVRRGIPVMGHIGLTPQTSAAHGGNRLRGKTAGPAHRLVEDAVALEDAGVFAVVLELVPAEVASAVSERLTIPTIGIGSGASCDGQVLVWHDLLGLSSAYGRHVRKYADLHATTLDALTAYTGDVRSGVFPDEEQTWHMAESDLAEFAAKA